MTYIAENIAKIKSTLRDGCELIAVSKRKPASDIVSAYNSGQRDFGENYIQELLDKVDELPNDIRWHFIGHLQSNKVKYIAPFVYMIHAVDSVKLLHEINKQALKNKRKISVLLQIHIAKEDSKFGFTIDELSELVESKSLNEFEAIEFSGLMAMATNTDDTSQISSEFESVQKLQKHCQSYFPNFNTLSIGMSQDYHIAMQYGSTYIRLGTSIFGSRL